MWRLYVCKLTDYGHKRYAWTLDGIIKYTRVITPYGWLPQEMNPFNVEFLDVNIHNKSITDYFEFKLAHHNMTQEELSKGWLT